MEDLQFLTTPVKNGSKESIISSSTQYLILLFISGCFLFLARYHWNRRRMYQMAAKISGPICFPIIGSAYLFIGSTEKIFSNIINTMDKYHSPFKVWIGPRLFFAISNPEHFKIILNHPKALGKDDLYKFLKPCLGEGLFTAPVEKWKKNRRILSPAFNQKLLNDFVGVFSEKSIILGNMLENHVDKVMNMYDLVQRTLIDIVSETTMGIEFNAKYKHTWIERIMNILHQRMLKIWLHPDVIFYNLPIGREFAEICKNCWNVTDEVIMEKRKSYFKQKELTKNYPEAQATEPSTKFKPFLEAILDISEEDETFTNEQIRSEVNTLYVAGVDTVSTMICFTFTMLGMHPEWQQKVYQEAMDVLGPDRPIEHTDLPKLKLIERCVHEVNRLYPIAPLSVRVNDDDIQLENVTLPEGSATVLVFIHMNRSEKYWPNPLKFDPDRFLPEEIAKRHPYAYVGFGAGPRNCIGKKYGIMAMKTMIAHLIRKFEISTPYGRVEDVRIKQDIIIKPIDGFKIHLTLRK